MTEIGSTRTSAVRDWPTFALRYTFDHGLIGLDEPFDADEVVVFDATRGRLDDRWIAAKRDAYVSVEEIR